LCEHTEDYLGSDMLMVEHLRKFMSHMQKQKMEDLELKDMWREFDNVSMAILEDANVSNRQYE
jgi:hypothetical protein